MIKYLTLAVKLQLNVHDLNNEAVAGNVIDIRIMEFLDENGVKREAPAVSGRMVKHWHYEAMRQMIEKGFYPDIPLCAGCGKGEPIRPGKFKQGKLEQDHLKSEKKSIADCAVCDVHGYLIAQAARQSEVSEESENEELIREKKRGRDKQEAGMSARRISRAMFSWLMPVLEFDSTSNQVIHNRVSSDPSVMMPFNKSYASGIYAFVSALDVDRIGLVESELGEVSPYAIDENQRKERIKVAIEGFRYMLSGQLGASLSHAIPHNNPLEVLAVYSESGPLPFPVSPIYRDYIEKTAGLMPPKAILLYWGKQSPAGITKKSSINEIFDELLTKI